MQMSGAASDVHIINILPFHFRGFCMMCALQLETCPMCRETIANRVEVA